MHFLARTCSSISYPLELLLCQMHILATSLATRLLWHVLLSLIHILTLPTNREV